MNNIKDLTTAQLQRIIAIKQEIEGLESELDSIGGGNGVAELWFSIRCVV